MLFEHVPRFKSMLFQGQHCVYSTYSLL